MSAPPYYQQLRKAIILFGSFFTDIQINRTTANGSISETETVPLHYAPKDKMLARVIADPDISRPDAIVLPVMSFEINTPLQYDASRKLKNTGKYSMIVDNGAATSYVLNPVPYNIGFKLLICVKNTEDGHKIIEQILPNFTPDYTVNVNLIDEPELLMDVPIVLNSVTFSDDYEGDFKTRRKIVWELDFTVKYYIYGEVKPSGVIRHIDVNFYIPGLNDVVPNTAVASIAIQPGLTANVQPTSNSADSIPVSEINANSNYGFVIEITENPNE